MSEVLLRQRVHAMNSQPRKVSTNRLGGFAVEQEEPVTPKATGFVEMRDCYIFHCDECGKSSVISKQGIKLVGNEFQFYKKELRDIKFCPHCGAKY